MTTTVVLASSLLSGSLLSMLVPMAIVIAVIAWGVLQIRRYEHRRGSAQARGRSAADADADTAHGSRSAGAG